VGGEGGGHKADSLHYSTCSVRPSHSSHSFNEGTMTWRKLKSNNNNANTSKLPCPWQQHTLLPNVMRCRPGSQFIRMSWIHVIFPSSILTLSLACQCTLLGTWMLARCRAWGLAFTRSVQPTYCMGKQGLCCLLCISHHKTWSRVRTSLD